MDDVAQAIVTILIVGLVLLLVVRLALAVPDRVRRFRRPEWRTIRVVGVGGGGSNAVDRMVAERVRGVQFVAVNTDAQALRRSRAGTTLRIGDAVTRGLGSGGDPDVGRRSAEEDVDRIGSALAGADLVFLAVGLGGGTGSGAAPIIAAKARERGALTIAVVTKPFGFEGVKRQHIAEEAAQELASEVDALITIPNDRAGEGLPPDASLADAFRHVDGILLEVVQAIIELLRSPGRVNVDFADLRATMHDAGPAVVGMGRAAGQDRAQVAAREAATSPLLEAEIAGARRILLVVAGSENLRLDEVARAADGIRAVADPDADIIFGATLRDDLGDEVHLTLIATDLDPSRVRAAAAAAPVEPAAPEGPAPVEPAAPEPVRVRRRRGDGRPPDTQAAAAPAAATPARPARAKPTTVDPAAAEPPPAEAGRGSRRQRRKPPTVGPGDPADGGPAEPSGFGGSTEPPEASAHPELAALVARPTPPPRPETAAPRRRRRRPDPPAAASAPDDPATIDPEV